MNAIIITFKTLTFKTTVGQKKGSAYKARDQEKAEDEELIDDIATTWYQVQLDDKNNMKLFELITLKNHLAINDGVNIPEATIRSRLRRGNLSNVKRGWTSPMADVELTLVCLLKCASRMGKHVSQR